MNLWLIPASDEAAQTNIPKTLSAEISAERASKAGILGNLHAWGAKASSDSNVNKFAKMAAGTLASSTRRALLADRNDIDGKLSLLKPAVVHSWHKLCGTIPRLSLSTSSGTLGRPTSRLKS